MIPIRLYAELGAVVILIGAFIGYTIHERHIGEQRIVAADAKAEIALKKQTDAETAANLTRAHVADAGADHDQQLIDDYRTAHPEQPVRLCHANSSDSGMPKTSSVNSSLIGTRPGPVAVQPVPDGTPGPDIGPGLDAIVQAAGRLATLYADRQQR